MHARTHTHVRTRKHIYHHHAVEYTPSASHLHLIRSSSAPQPLARAVLRVRSRLTVPHMFRFGE
eukprot:4553276-Pleurochrysis_carterae.AAC.1